MTLYTTVKEHRGKNNICLLLSRKCHMTVFLSLDYNEILVRVFT